MNAVSAFDVVVVGGGVLARAAALGLAQTGRRVAVVADGVPGATMAAAGMLAPQFERDHPRTASDLFPVLDAALARWPAFAESLQGASGDDIDFHLSGIVGLDLATKNGRAVPVPPGFEASQARIVDGEGQVDPRLTLAALQKAGAASSVETFLGRVRGLSVSGSVRCTLEDDQTLTASRVVVASGALGDLLPADGPKPFPVRGRAFRVVRPAHFLDHVVRTRRVYFCPKSDGAVYVGATEEPTEADSEAPLSALWAEAVRIFPGFADAEILGTFDGLRPASPTGMPIIEPVSPGGEVIALGGTDRNGILLTPWCADQLVALVEALDTGSSAAILPA